MKTHSTVLGLLLALATVCIGCGSGVSGVATPLGETGAEIDVPAGWRVTDLGEIKGERRFDVEFGEQSGMDWRVVGCGTMPMLTSIDELYDHEEVCGIATSPGTKGKISSGAFIVECTHSAFGTELAHVSVAINVGGKTVRCWHQPLRVTPEHRFIVHSLRATR